MCFGGGGKQSIPSPTPLPAPAPIPTEAQAAVINPKAQLDRLRYGLASTIKTSARGLTGSGSNLTSQNRTGKTALGA